MKKNSTVLKMLSVFLAFLFIFNFNSIVMASSGDIEMNYMGYEQEIEMKPQSVSGVLVLVGGIVIGYIIDGVFTAIAGVNISTAIANGINRAIDYIRSHSYVSQVFLNKSGDILGYGGGGTSFSLPVSEV